MTTNITAGQKIRVAVPVSPADNTPIGDRTETRIATVEKVEDDGTIHETEGRVLASRMGIDWEIYRGEAVDPGASAVAVRLASGVVRGDLVRVVRSSAEIYSEQFQPPGVLAIPVAKCGKSWDWLRGGKLLQVGEGLTEDFAPNADKPRTVSASDPPDKEEPQKPAGKKRGPKPRAASVATTGVTEVLPVVLPAPVEFVIVPTFAQRARIWNIARELDVEAEVGNVGRVESVVEKLAALCREIRGGVGRG